MFKENLLLFSSKFIKQKEYWISKLSGQLEETVLTLERSNSRTAGLQRLEMEIPLTQEQGKISEKLIKLSKESDLALYIILLAALKVLIHRCSGREDVIVQAPVYRMKISEETLNNRLFLRDALSGPMTFKETVLAVRKTVLDAHANQDYTCEKIIDFLFNTSQPLDNNSISNIVCSLKNIHDPKNIETLKGKIAFIFERTNRQVMGTILYNPDVYEFHDVRRLSGYFIRLLANVLDNVDKPVTQLSFLTEEEKKKLLWEFNDTRTQYPSHKTVHQLFEEQAIKTPEHTAAAKIDSVGGSEALEASSLSYAQLNEKANQLARQLKTRGVVPGSAVAVMADHSLETVVALLAVLKAGGAYLAVDHDYPGPRRQFMVKDSNAVLALVQHEFFDNMQDHCETIDLGAPGLYRGPGDNPEPIGASHDVAYLIYTSGSTGTPKGVLVEHKSIVRLVKNTNYIQFSEDTRLLQTGALEFDASTFEIWGCLLNGAGLYLLSRNDILVMDILERALVNYNINQMWLTSGLFNQVFDCVPGIFGTLRCLVVGGDVLSPFRINRLREMVPGITVINGYGPTENTTFSACFLIDRDYESNIPIGPPISNTRAYIIDKYDGLQAIGTAGHLCFAGDGLARGYLNNPEFTAEKFRDNPLVPGERIYLTGDLARWLPDGTIEFLGRIDQQMKIRGYRIEPGEIEHYLLEIDGVRECVVHIFQDAVVQDTVGSSEKCLCAYLVTDNPIDDHELKQVLSARLPDYMVPSFFIRLKAIPLTSNGKVDRRVLPKPEIKAGDNYIAPRDDRERKLVRIFADVLNLDEKSIGIDCSFFDLGGHSLKAVVLIARIHKELNIKIKLTEIFKMPTVRALAHYASGAVEDKYAAIDKAPAKDYYLLSSAQKRMYVLQQRDVQGTVYNVTHVMVIDEGLDKYKVHQVFLKLIDRHESLRTSFEMQDGEPVQKIHGTVEFGMEYVELGERENRDREIEKITAAFVRPFDLSHAPLLRAKLIENDANDVLMIDMHHIIADGTSINILIKDFKVLYAGGRLPELRLQYKDYSEWQNNLIKSGELKKQEKFWLDRFETLPAALNLPTDYERPNVQSFEGNSVQFELGAQETAALNKLSKSNDATLFMTLLAVFDVLMFKLSGQQDIVVGTPTACRSHADLENIVGMFVNTLALGNRLEGHLSFSDFLQQVKEQTLLAFENQEYQFEDLVEKVIGARDVSRNPIFDVTFGLQNQNDNLMDVNAEKLLAGQAGLYDTGNRIAKFDITLAGVEAGDTVLFLLEYSSRLYKESTILGFIEYFKRITAEVVQDSQKTLAGIDILTARQKHRLLVEFNRTYDDVDVPAGRTLEQLFEEQVRRTPGHTALVYEDRDSGGIPITYERLNERADGLAQILREKGVGEDCIVAMLLEPSIEMAVGILGILKAGGAYLPIEPDYPEERITYLMMDSKAALLLTMPGAPDIEGLDTFTIDISSISPASTAALTPAASDRLACVIYTSGTTGRPKGAAVLHGGLVNYTCWRRSAYNYKETDTALQLLSYCFDGFGANFYTPLLSGAAVVMLPSSKKLDFDYIKEIVRNTGITNISLVPSMFEQILDCAGPGDLDSLRFVVLAGEKASARLIKTCIEKSPNALLINEYGPTEASVTAAARIDMDENTAIIGRSIANVNVYIMDAFLNPVPPGVIGDIYISGAGIARGYLNRPELTAESFFYRSYKSYRTYKIYKTGDLGHWLPDGSIRLMGRADQQVKIRGLRIEPGEIEGQLLEHVSVKQAVVMDRLSKTGETYLCAYIALHSPAMGPQPGTAQLREHLSDRLPGYMIPSYFLVLPELPLTTTGKIDRQRLPDPEDVDFAAPGGYIAPTGSIETKLAIIWQRILGKDKIGIYDDFFMMGGHSLKATTAISDIYKELNVKVPLQEIFQRPTIKRLAEYITKAEKSDYISIEPAPAMEYYPASSQQKRMYFIQQIDPGSTAHNCPMIHFVRGNSPGEKLEHAFRQLIARHESLRTSFIMIGGQPVQDVHKEQDVAFEFQYYEAGGKNEVEKIVGGFIRPFDLSQAPLLRGGLITQRDDRHVLVVDMHHIISDGTSMKTITGDFFSLYNGKELPALRLHYKDYACWQNSETQKQALARQEAFWLETLNGDLPVIDLPLDYPRPMMQSFAGDRISFQVSKDVTGKLQQLANAQGATLFMVLLAAYNILLARLHGSGDIVVGVPIAGRRHADLEHIVGLFLNTLVLRNNPASKKTFIDFLGQLKENTLKAFENQEYQFEDLVEKLSITRDTSRNPLVDVMFNFFNLVEKLAASPSEAMADQEEYPYENLTAKVDLFLSGVEINDGLFFELEYCTRLFKPATIRRFIYYFERILSQIAREPGCHISGFDILPEEEKKCLLYDFNNTGSVYPGDKTLVRLLEEQVEKVPDAAAVRFEDRTLTYGCLNRNANRLARMLRESGVTDGALVGVLLSRTDELAVGVIGILKAGAVCLPLDLNYPAKRITGILTDSGTGFLVKHESHDYVFASSFPGVIVNSDSPGRENFNDGNPGYCGDPHSFAFAIYTSGSTGKPKGTLLYHYGISNHVFTKIEELAIDGRDMLCHNLNIVFVASIWQFFAPLFTGAQFHVYPGEIISHPYELFRRAAKDVVTVLEVVPSLLNAYLELLKTGKEPIALNWLKRLVLTGENVPPSLVNRYYRRYDILLVNAYGQSECSDDTLHYHIPYNRETTVVPIGRPSHNTRVYILGAEGNLCPMGVAGQLYISGCGLAAGYLNQPSLTGEKFVANPFEKGEKMFATGDLARYLADGNVECLGRVDQQIKIRGFRVEPGEIESRLLDIDGIQGAVVIASGDEQYLYAYVVAGGEIDTTALRNILSDHLPGYMVPAYFVQLEAIPQTSSGKVDRKSLPAVGPQNLHEYMAPVSEVEKKLVDIWSEVLGAANDKIGRNANFFQLGGHSLAALYAIEKIHRSLNTRVPLAEIFNRQTLEELARYIENAAGDKYAAVEPAEEREYYPLSPAQERLYFIYRMAPHTTAYNLPVIQVLDSDVRQDRLEHIFKKLLGRHESLRTSFRMLGELPVQVIHGDVEFKIEYVDLSADYPGQAGETIAGNLVRPFDLTCAPPLRVILVKQEENRLILVVDIHHIAADGTSLNILMEEFMSLYEGRDTERLTVRYKDYVLWCQGSERQESIKAQEAFWLQQFDDETPVLNLPLDFQRPRVQSFEGGRIYFDVGTDVFQALDGVCRQEDVTLYMVLLAAFKIVLARLSGQEDIVAGTPTAGRRHADLEHIVGMFVNTLALRSYPQSQKSIKQFLRELKQLTIDAFDNQDYPFEDLAAQVFAARDTGRNPLFDVMFTLQNQNPQVGTSRPEDNVDLIRFPDVYESGHRVARLDMTLFAAESGGRLVFHLEYCSKLFRTPTIRRFIDYYKKILTAIAGDLRQSIASIDILPREEKRQILYDFNDTHASYPDDKTVHRLFDEQAERTPGRVALLPYMTYEQLKRKTDGLARYLRARGIGAGSIVGIMTERTPDMVVGILGILKAGSAWLPIDPLYPRRRVRYMLEDSKASLLLIRGTFPGTPDDSDNVVNLQDETLYGEDLVPLNMVSPAGPRDLAYVLYTSGSTGNPKGVMVKHTALVNILWALDRYYPFGENDVYLLKTPYIFDVALTELFGWFIGGGSLAILEPNAEKDPQKIAAAIRYYGVTHLNFVPSMFNAFVNALTPADMEAVAGLKYIFLAGEALPPGLIAQFQALLSPASGVRLENIYGPTEAAIYASRYSLSGWEPGTPILIGKPVSNVQLYILDRYNHPVPLRCAGELCIAGKGVAVGYLNRPGLTAEKFLPGGSFRENRPLDPRKSFCMNKNSRLYKTGDLARWLPDGNIEFLGRIDHQVKIRGIRIELGEIEKQLTAVDGITEAVVINRRLEDGETYLAAYIVFSSADDGEPDRWELRRILAQELPPYMIPTYFIKLAEIPLTPGGKIDRRALPAPGIEAGENYAPPRTEKEKKLVGIWSDVLMLPGSVIGIDNGFFELGGHSIKAITLVGKIHKEFNVQIPLAAIFDIQTIRRMARYLEDAELTRYKAIEPVEDREYYAQSSAQKRLYFLQYVQPGSTAYNTPLVLELAGDPPLGKLTERFVRLINRHEALRTSFETIDGEPVQRIHGSSAVAFQMEFHEAGPSEVNTLAGNFIRPFDLSQAPLLRAGLIRLRERRNILLVDIHHIILDGVSQDILVRDFSALYNDMPLPALKLRYRDFSGWQNKLSAQGAFKRQEAYWLKRFEEAVPSLRLPVDFPAGPELDSDGRILKFQVPGELAANIKKLLSLTGTTLYMALMAAYNVLLFLYTRQEDIVVGSPIAGRRHADLEHILGIFVNMLPMRNRPQANKTFRKFLAEVKENSLDAFDNQDYQYDELVNRLGLKGNTPLVKTVFTLQNSLDSASGPDEKRDENAAPLSHHDDGRTTIKFPLTLDAVERQGGIHMWLTYSTTLFTPATAEKIKTHFIQVLEQVTDNPGITLQEVRVSSGAATARSGVSTQDSGDFDF